MRHISPKQIRDGGAQKAEASSQTRDRPHGIADTGPAPITGRDQAVWWIIATGAVLLAVIALGTAFLVANLRDGARADAKHVLNTTTFIIAEHVEGTLQSVELVQRNVIERMQSFGIASGEDLDRLMSGIDAHLMLKDMVSGVPHLDALTLVDPSGKLVVSSRNWPRPEASETEREYFQALASDR